MSATTRHAKAAALRAGNDRLREERNAMIQTNAELLIENEILRDWLNDQTTWANHYHAEGLALREELEAARGVIAHYNRRNVALKARVMELEEQAKRWNEVQA